MLQSGSRVAMFLMQLFSSSPASARWAARSAPNWVGALAATGWREYRLTMRPGEDDRIASASRLPNGCDKTATPAPPRPPALHIRVDGNDGHRQPVMA